MIHLSFIQEVIVWSLPVLFAITFHEVAHGWVASKLGDKTAELLGRLSINPLKHIDLIGTVIVPLLLLTLGGFIFGWARPVPINPVNFRNQKRGMLLVSLAGPFANFLMAVFWAIIAKIGIILMTHNVALGTPVLLMGQRGIMVNIVFAVLNLIPLPPLDGGRIVMSLLPNKIAYHYSKIEPFGFLILLALIMLGVLSLIISPIISYIVRFLVSIFGLH